MFVNTDISNGAAILCLWTQKIPMFVPPGEYYAVTWQHNKSEVKQKNAGKMVGSTV